MLNSNGSGGIVVFTTHERTGYFTSVLGDDIDIRLSPKRGFLLQNSLHNILVAGGALVVIDEAFFMDIDDLALGLERFFVSEKHAQRLKLILVCTHRKAGDIFLAFLVLYCHIYNIIYDKTGVDVSISLLELIDRDNTFYDVSELADRGRWERVASPEMQALAERTLFCEEACVCLTDEFSFDVVHMDVQMSVGNGRNLTIGLDISGEVE